MKTQNGLAPAIANGTENYEHYFSEVVKKELCDYDYRDTDGELFSCIKTTLTECREKRNQWLAKKPTS